MTGKEKNEQCTTCRKFLHTDCVTRWLQHQTTCCYCRSEWVVKPAATGKTTTTHGGYLNYGAVQGGMKKASNYNFNYNKWGWRRKYY